MRPLLAAMVMASLLPSHALAEPMATREPPTSPISTSNRQLLLVHSPSWYASSGALERYERGADGNWRVVGTRVAVSLGRHGMAWGRGLQQPPDHGPIKKEGDGKSPAGAFALERAFGVAAGLPDAAHGFPYLATLPSTYCVEDTRSEFYNLVIDSREATSKAWERWSPLRRPDGLFDWGVIVRQNEPDVHRGAGSCVFLHIWRGPGVPTAGCTAMARQSIEAIVSWLVPDARPVLVQLPEPELTALRARWALPD
jgi:L,D-peptidoglycan transpeptidase YkuD (ErfK/YbiS/YcfS/YnhG family)